MSWGDVSMGQGVAQEFAHGFAHGFSQLTGFDWLVITIIFLSMVLGAMRGMVREVLSLINLLAAFVLANRFGPEAGTQMAQSLSQHMPWVANLAPAMHTLLGCVVVFSLAMMVGTIIVALLGRIVAAAGLGAVDRFFGAGFGVMRGLCLIMVVATGAGLTPVPTWPFWRNAVLSPHVEQGMRWVKPYLPDAMARWVRY
jgi:membrane protein required for colicin V production